MSRVSSRTPASNTNNEKSLKDSTLRYKNMGPVFRILNIFMESKQRHNTKIFWDKCKQLTNYRKKRNAIISTFLNSLQQRKSKMYVSYIFRKLIAHRDSELKGQAEQIQSKKQLIKSKSVTLIGIIYNKLYLKKMKATFQHLSIQSRAKFKLQSYRNRHIGRIFSTLTISKLRLGFDAILRRKIPYLNIKSSLKRLQKLFRLKRQYNIGQAFLKLQLNTPTKSQQAPTATQPAKGSRVKQTIGRSNVRPTPNIVNQDEQKKKQLESKNKKLEEEIKALKQSNEKIIQQCKKQLADQQAEFESLKFNSGILDEAIRELETEILNRQKRSRKVLSNAQLWDRVYSNFLMLLNQYAGQVLPKQKVLEHLECPLVPLNVNLDTLRSENQILTELLGEYRKFYEGKAVEELSGQDLLPYDILLAKNKFFYAAVETLIRQGLGTEEEIKQLQTDLQNVTKQTP